MLKALDGLDADAGERADILSRENGKVRFEAAVDLQVFVGRFHQTAEFTPELDTPERIAGPPFNTTITKLPAGWSRSSTRSTGRWRSWRPACRTR